MNKVVTSREEILNSCKQLVRSRGLNAINIRSVASQCGISIGSVYNYYNSKNDLVIATVEAIWREIIDESEYADEPKGFVEELERLFDNIKRGNDKYPLFFAMHIAGFDKAGIDEGRKVMSACFEYLQAEMLKALNADSRIKKDFFSEALTREAFVAFLLGNMLTLFLKKEESCQLMLEIVKRSLYL